VRTKAIPSASAGILDLILFDTRRAQVTASESSQR
jgi:hypothetical protein